MTQRALGFEGSAAPRRKRFPWDFAFPAAWRRARPGFRKCKIPREPPAPRRRAPFKPSRALGHSGPPAAAPFKPWVKTFLPGGKEFPSLRIFCSLARGKLLSFAAARARQLQPICPSLASLAGLAARRGGRRAARSTHDQYNGAAGDPWTSRRGPWPRSLAVRAAGGVGGRGGGARRLPRRLACAPQC